MTLSACSGGDEGGGDWEMSQRHQEAPRGDGVQEQQVTQSADPDYCVLQSAAASVDFIFLWRQTCTAVTAGYYQCYCSNNNNSSYYFIDISATILIFSWSFKSLITKYSKLEPQSIK